MPSQTGSIDLTAQVSANNNAKDYSDNVVDNLVVGGRNLFVSGSASNGYPTDAAVGNAYGVSNMSANHEAYEKIPVEEESSYIVQYWVDDSAHAGWVCIQLLDSSDVIKNKICRTYPAADYWTTTIDIPTGVSQMLVSGRHLASGYAYAKIKVEKGNKATDWTPAPEDQEALVTSTRTWYATCDTAAATVAKVATTTDSGFTLHDGVVVDVKFANTNSGAVGSLTLNVNDTGAKSIKTMYNNSLANLTTAGQLYAGLVVRFVYSGTYWIAATNYNSDTVDRKRINNAVMVSENVTAYAICGRSGTGHKKLVSGLAIDISYPIAYLYAGNISGQSYAVASGGTTTTFYTAIPGVNLQSTKASWTGTQYAMCYIKGTLSGSTFTVHSDVFTTTVPTSDDGLAYIPIGMMVSTYQVNFDCDNTVYAYRNGKFQKFDTVSNYITVDNSGIKIHMAGNSSTYQHQTSDSTTFYVGGKKRSQVGADGLKVYVGINETEMASFGTSTRIGKAYVKGATDNESHLELDYRSMRMVDKDGNEFFKIEDLRGTNGVATITDTFFSDGYSRSYSLSALAENTSYTVNVSDSSGGTPTKTLQYVEFETPPNEGSIITVVYSLTSAIAKSYTFGIRGIGNIGPMSVAEGSGTIASGMYSHAEGLYSISSSWASHAEGNACDATGPHSHAEGAGTNASGEWSHSEGYETEATNAGSHAEGQYAVSNAPASHAEGYHTLSSYGYGSILYGSHAEGYYSQALDAGAHAEGFYTVASGQASHAEGSYCTASAAHTHAQNYKTVAGYGYQTTIGKYNDNKSNTAFEIGNGTSDNNRSNAATIDWNGNYIGQAMAGIIQMFAGATPPTGWLVCDGSAVSRTTYATLFAAIGTTWGAGDGSTTFNIPDLRGRTPIGAGTGSGLTARTLGDALGAETHNHGGNSGEVTLSAAQSGLPAHTHSFTQPTVKTELLFQKNVASGSAVNRVAGSNLSNPDTTTTYTATVTGGAVGAVTDGAKAASSSHKHTISSNANIPPAAIVNFIICTGKTS